MFHSVMSNSTFASEEPNNSSGSRVQDFCGLTDPMLQNSIPVHPPQTTKKKRNLPGNPDPDAEVIALSPRTLMATNRFVCEICNKGFQRDQNLQLHRRGHNLPWKLKQRNNNQNKKRVYVCPETTCVHHNASRALGDLTGIKKHFCRKHGEKKWKCEKCSKIYAVQSDWKAHIKTCGTREYRCDCGTVFSRKDSFITHRAFCDALAEESARLTAATNSILAPNPNNNNDNNSNTTTQSIFHFTAPHQSPPPPPSSLFPFSSQHRHFPNPWGPPLQDPNSHAQNDQVHVKHEALHIPLSSSSLYQEMQSPFCITSAPVPLSATALLQKAATVGAAGHRSSTMAHLDMHVDSTWEKRSDHFTRDFLGLTRSEQCEGSGSGNLRDMVYDHHDHSMLKHQGLGFAETSCLGAWGSR